MFRSAFQANKNTINTTAIFSTNSPRTDDTSTVYKTSKELKQKIITKRPISNKRAKRSPYYVPFGNRRPIIRKGLNYILEKKTL